MKALYLSLLSLLCLSVTACSGGESATDDGAGTEAAPKDPIANLEAHLSELAAKPEHTEKRVEVQHLLVSFAGAGTRATRTKEEAQLLAAQLFARVQAGEDFDGMVKEFTDDSHPGIYVMRTDGPTDMANGIFNRHGMVPAFGNVGWKLEVGEVGVAAHHPSDSPYGWHIVRRQS